MRYHIVWTKDVWGVALDNFINRHNNTINESFSFLAQSKTTYPKCEAIIEVCNCNNIDKGEQQ